MTGPGQPFRGIEYSSRQNAPPDPYAPVDYPPLPPPVYLTPPVGGYPYPADPYDPYRPMKPPGTNAKAIAALVISVAGLMFCGLPSIAGLILGVIAMRETRRTGQDGYGFALAGAIIGGFVVALWVLYWVLVVAILASSGFQSPP
jgi:hypothetical protein